MPYTKESLNHFADKVKQAQDYLGRQILIENPSFYLQFSESDINEWNNNIPALSVLLGEAQKILNA